MPLEELVDPDCLSETSRAADRQSGVSQGGDGRAEHRRDHGCGEGRELPAECGFPGTPTSRPTPTRARTPTTSMIRRWRTNISPGRIQERAGRAADQQGLHLDVQCRAGDGGADEGDRRECAVEGGGLADLDRHAAETRFRLELFLHRLGDGAIAGSDTHHAGAGAAQSGLFAKAGEAIRNWLPISAT